jgi:hypothetical protein
LWVTGFGLSLEHPTPSEQTMRTTANKYTLRFPKAALATFLVILHLPQDTELKVVRVMVVASCRVAAT